MRLKVSSAKRWPFCLGYNVLNRKQGLFSHCLVLGNETIACFYVLLSMFICINYFSAANFIDLSLCFFFAISVCLKRAASQRETTPLQWRHYERDGVSNEQPHDCLLKHLFRHRSKKTSKIRVTVLCEGNSPVNSPHKGPVTRKMCPFDDVIMHSSVELRFAVMYSKSLMIQYRSWVTHWQRSTCMP